MHVRDKQIWYPLCPTVVFWEIPDHFKFEDLNDEYTKSLVEAIFENPGLRLERKPNVLKHIFYASCPPFGT